MSPIANLVSRSLFAIGCLASSLTLIIRPSQAATFQGLGVNTYVYEVAGDGSKVVGASGNASNPTAGYWSASTGWVSLNWGEPGTRSYAVSGDGSIIAGYSNADHAYRWTAATGATVIPNADVALDISADGAMIVGMAPGDGDHLHAFRYTVSGGTIDMSTASGMPSRSQSRGVSGDGKLIAGSSNRGLWLWNAANDSVELLDTASTQLDPWSLSANGTTIVGNVSVNGQNGAGYWRRGEGVVMVLPITNGDTAPRDVTADGSTLTGYYYPDNEQRAWIWDQAHGARRVEEMLLQDYGLNIGNWRLQWAYISDDGKTLAGSGFNPNGQAEAWVVTVPEPAALLQLSLGAILFH